MQFAVKIALYALAPAAVFAGRMLGGGPCCELPGAGSADPATGAYVEARTASVFAGPCHYNGEYTTQGRAELLAWSLDGGREAGVDLAGVELVVLVRADRNLADPDARRESVIYLDEALAPEVRAAARAWLEREHADALGAVRAVRVGEVRVATDGERFEVEALGLARLAGEAMPDRACCSMPSSVWYAPETPLAERLVGYTEVFEARDPDLGPAFVRRGENSAFVGRLAAAGEAGVRCEAALPSP